MKTILLAALVTAVLAQAAPAFAHEAHNDSTAAGARGTWRTNESDGAVAKQFQAAVDPRDAGHIAPRVGLSDSAAIS